MKIKKGELCPTCGRYYSRHVTVDPLVIKDGKVLMIKRAEGIRMGGYWALPGGYVEWNETTEEAALRELKDETGIGGEIISFFGIYSDPSRDEDGRQNIDLVYLIKPLKQSSKIDKKEVEKVAWFSLDKLPEKIAFDHRKIIKDYLRKA